METKQVNTAAVWNGILTGTEGPHVFGQGLIGAKYVSLHAGY